MKKGKIVIISGNKRAGKTTLTMKLHQKLGFNFYNFDSITDSLEEVHTNLEGDPYYIKFLEEMVGYALEFAKNYGISSVFEYIDFTPELMKSFKYINQVEIYYLANLDATIDNIRDDLKKYSKPYDWPSYCSEEDLERNIKFILSTNEKLIKDCKKYNFKLINTKRAKEREKVLNDLTKIIGKDM